MNAMTELLIIRLFIVMFIVAGEGSLEEVTLVEYLCISCATVDIIHLVDRLVLTGILRWLDIILLRVPIVVVITDTLRIPILTKACVPEYNISEARGCL